MEHKNLSKKSFILAIFLSVVTLCGMIFFAASSGTGNTAYSESRDFEDMCRLKEIELMDILSHFDKVNKVMPMIQVLDNEISAVYVTVFMKEEMSDSEKDSISEFVSEYFEEHEKEKIEIDFISF